MSLLMLNEAPVWMAQPLYQSKLHPCVLRVRPGRLERRETRRSPVNNVAAALSPILRPQPDSPVPLASVPLEMQRYFHGALAQNPWTKPSMHQDVYPAMRSVKGQPWTSVWNAERPSEPWNLEDVWKRLAEAR